MKTTAIALAGIATLAILPALCRADAPPEGWSTVGNAALASNYIARGFTQSWSGPVLQGGYDLSHSGGAFVGTWASTLSTREFKQARAEIDLYAGWNFSLGDATVTAAVVYYAYPGSSSPYIGGRRYDYAEIKLGVSQGPWSATHYTVVTDDWFGTFTGGRGGRYTEFNYQPSFDEGWGAQVHVGIGGFPRHGEANWHEAKLGLTKTLAQSWTASLALTRGWDKNRFYTAADFRRDPQGVDLFYRLGKPALTLMVGKTF